MEQANLGLWLGLLLSGLSLAWLVARVYWPEHRRTCVVEPRRNTAAAGLLCVDGTQVDRAASWFPLRPDEVTVLGHLPRKPQPGLRFHYFHCEDLEPEQARVSYRVEDRLFSLEAVAGEVRHNERPLEPGRQAALREGDTIHLGEVLTLRFTWEGPEA